MTPGPDVRYPVGRFDFKDPSRLEDRPLFLAQLGEAPEKLRAAVAGLSDSQLDTPYREGGWTPRQVVHHLADAHVNWHIRTKLAVTEEMPVTKPYAEQLWAELADARTSPVEPSLRIFEGVTARWLRFFESLTPGDWPRRFTNPEWGTLTVEDTLRAMAWHSRHHTAHITELRKRMGWQRHGRNSVAFFFMVRFEPLPGKEAAFREELLRVNAPSRAEAGCLGIDVFESVREPTVFAVHSVWADEAAFEVHAGLPHTVQFLKAAETLLTRPVQGLRLRQIGGGPGAAAQARALP